MKAFCKLFDRLGLDAFIMLAHVDIYLLGWLIVTVRRLIQVRYMT